MGPQETKDERRAIYFGPLFPRHSAVARRRACESPRLRTASCEGGRVGGDDRGSGDMLPTSEDGCREPHAIKAKRYETLRGSSPTAKTYIAFRQSQGSIVPFAADNELTSFNTTVKYLQWLGGEGPIFRQENSDSNFMQMAAAARWYTKGCVTKVGRGWPPEPATRNFAPRVGQEGGKKSDKTMERNLNYAPRKMAIVCKAMLIRRRRKTGGRRLRRRRQTRRRRFFLSLPEFISFFFFFPSSSPDPRGSPLLRPFSRTLPVAIFTCRSTFPRYVPRLIPFVLSIYLRIVLYCCVPRVWSPQFRMINGTTRGVTSQMTHALRRMNRHNRHNRNIPLFKRVP
ncbi:hypothetical protein X777_16178 [Ooceraea biroi]|uniref:Uncharacterized protein n=1 Tax=Ooceraea biroi TaxID=2015173 RepID=A0A026WV97_OOCBI|nr:hypothetical protein X777_16178 [Ooceraea biroi]